MSHSMDTVETTIQSRGVIEGEYTPPKSETFCNRREFRLRPSREDRLEAHSHGLLRDQFSGVAVGAVDKNSRY